MKDIWLGVNRSVKSVINGSNFDREDLRTFRFKAIKEEVALAMSSLLETNFLRKKERSGIGYLDALLRGQRPLFSV